MVSLNVGGLGAFAFGTLVLVATLFSSIIYLSIKKYAEKLSELAAADFYEEKVRKTKGK